MLKHTRSVVAVGGALMYSPPMGTPSLVMKLHWVVAAQTRSSYREIGIISHCEVVLHTVAFAHTRSLVVVSLRKIH